MAWSDAARKAALEARRRNSKHFNQTVKRYSTYRVLGKTIEQKRAEHSKMLRQAHEHRGAGITDKQMARLIREDPKVAKEFGTKAAKRLLDQVRKSVVRSGQPRKKTKAPYVPPRIPGLSRRLNQLDRAAAAFKRKGK